MRSNFPLCSSFCGYLTMGLVALVGVMPICGAYASCKGGQIHMPDQQHYSRKQTYCWSPASSSMSADGHVLTLSEFAVGRYAGNCKINIDASLKSLQSDGLSHTRGLYYGPGSDPTTFGYKIEGNKFRCTASFSIGVYSYGKMIRSKNMTISYRPFYQVHSVHGAGRSGAKNVIVQLIGTVGGEGAAVMPITIPGNDTFGNPTNVTYGFCLSPHSSAIWNQTPPSRCYWLN